MVTVLSVLIILAAVAGVHGATRHINITCGSGCDTASYFDVSIDGAAYEPNPIITAMIDDVLIFYVDTGKPHTVALHIAPGQIATSYRYNESVTNNGVFKGTIVWYVSAKSPAILYYQSEGVYALFGRINVAGVRTPEGAGPEPAPEPVVTAPPAPVPARFWTPVCFGVDSTTSNGGAGIAGGSDGGGPVSASPETNPKYQQKLLQQQPNARTTRSIAHTRGATEYGRGTTKYFCSTSTRAEQLMDLALFTLHRESSAATETCFQPGAPGIFTPNGSARMMMAVSVAQFNAWSTFDKFATAVRSPNAPRKRLASRDRTKANKEIAMTFAVYHVIKFLLPARAADTATSILAAYGLDMEAPAKYGFAGQIGVAAAADFIENHLKKDGSNQEQCYKSTVPDLRTDAPVKLDSFETVNQSLTTRRNFYKWADVTLSGVIGTRPFLTSHALKWTRIAISEDEAKELAKPTHLPTDAEQDVQMDELTKLQVDFIQKPELKILVSLWADGPKSTLPPGHWQEIATDSLARRRCYDLDTAVKMFLLTGVGVYEAGIACWEQKYNTQTVRPSEFIPMKYLTTSLPNSWLGQNCPLGTIQGWQWRGYALPALICPAFAAYPSGHSTFSNASATIMALFTGSEEIYGGPVSFEFTKGSVGFKNKLGWEPQCFANGTTFDGETCKYVQCKADPTHDSSTDFAPSRDGALGPFVTWKDMAYSAGISRLYGGYHISADNVGGLTLGTEVGKRVFKFLCDNHIKDCNVGRNVQCLAGAASGLSTFFAFLAVLIFSALFMLH